MQWVYRVARENGYKKDEVDMIKKHTEMQYRQRKMSEIPSPQTAGQSQVQGGVNGNGELSSVSLPLNSDIQSMKKDTQYKERWGYNARPQNCRAVMTRPI